VIIKGGSRASGAALGVYLQNQERNERATVLDIRGTVSKDVVGALKEMEAYAEGTKCQLPLYHAQLNPEPPYRLTPEQLAQSLDRLEDELGLSGQPRVVVAHENEGREHFHIVWARIDLEKMRAIPDSHNYKKHEAVSRELEREFGHPRIQGAHAERENVERPERSPSRAELRQEERTGIKGRDVKEEVTALFRGSEDAEVFANSLDDAGYILAKGDRRDFVIVDRAGGDHSLARRIQGMKAAELRKFMAPIDREALPTVDEAKGMAEDRLYGGSAFDQQCWEDALATSAIDHADAVDRDHAQKADDARQDYKDSITEKDNLAWEDQLAASAIQKTVETEEELKRRLKEARKDANIEAAYARGDDFGHQTMAAQLDHERRTELQNEIPRAQHPDDHVPPTIENAFDHAGQEATDRLPLEIQEVQDSATGEKLDKIDNSEMSDDRYERMQRLLNRERGDEEVHDRDDDPDRQREVPGGGRTRDR
jgi:hypothetical protein